MIKIELLGRIKILSFYFIIAGEIISLASLYQFYELGKNTAWATPPVIWEQVLLCSSPFVLLIFVVISSQTAFSKFLCLSACVFCMLVASTLLNIQDPQHGFDYFTGALLFELAASLLIFAINTILYMTM